MAKPDYIPLAQQRAHDLRMKMVAIGLEAHLRLLIRDILAGDLTKAQEFQQYLCYASPELKTRLLEDLENKTI